MLWTSEAADDATRRDSSMWGLGLSDSSRVYPSPVSSFVPIVQNEESE